ncbi:MAG: hypothetical protein R2815_11580 [Flavobacteriales bacterium]
MANTRTDPRNQGLKLNAVVVDLDRDKAAINRYITIQALHDSYKVTFEKAGFIVKAFSFGTISGLKNLDIDMTLYGRLKKEYQWKVQSRVTDHLNRPGVGWAEYVGFINRLGERTRQLQHAMEELRKEVMQHNAREGDLAAKWGRAYSVVKAGADTGVAWISVFTPGAGSAIATGYTAATEAINVISDPRKADVLAFKGTGTGIVFAVAQERSKRILTEHGQRVLLGGPGAVIATLFAGMDLKDNLKAFD